MSFEWPLYIIAAKLVFVYMDCGGIYNFPPCCVGEKWDKIKNIRTKCPRGLYGDNCTHSCKVLYFGHRCVLGACKCNRVSCKIPTQICFPTTETDVSGSTLVSATEIVTTNERVKRTSVTPDPFSVKPDTRDEDPGPRGSAAASNIVYIIPITCVLTVFLLTVFMFVFCNKHCQLCNILNRKRHINSNYELPARVYENNGSTNSYDTPDTNTNISPTQGASESSYEFVEQFRKDL
ncbi:uncharacterized protein LOC128183018 [Crassostrea angulata]|uniref:uncharacterized protein LOC128183018 n=1 Tax=Magallana angulata TaxID=2784310 RepID=UPI0022B0FB21|nr:uncharacterized protein LOC128183018 [Crassostrea angulata]